MSTDIIIPDAVRDHKFEYFTGSFPLKMVADNRVLFSDMSPLEFEGETPAVPEWGFEFHKLGKIYAYHNLGVLYSANYRMVNDEIAKPLPEFVESINEFAAGKGTGKRATKQTKNLVIATCRGMIVGIMKTYKAVSNIEILASIQASSLGENITYVKQTLTEMTVKVRGSNDSGTRFGLLVTNGNTGYTGFRVDSYWRTGTYEKTLKEDFKFRHLKEVPEALRNFHELAAKALAFKLDMFLMDRDNVYWAARRLSDGLAKAYDKFETARVEDLQRELGASSMFDTGMQMIEWVMAYGSDNRGAMPLARFLVDHVVSSAEEMLRTGSKPGVEVDVPSPLEVTSEELIAATAAEMPPELKVDVTKEIDRLTVEAPAKRGPGRPRKIPIAPVKVEEEVEYEEDAMTAV